MEKENIKAAVEAILFAAGEPVPAARMSLILETDEDSIYAAAKELAQPALETLAVVAYFQPVTRAYIDQVRGVDSSYTVGVLLDRGLIERCGKLDVPGRPSLLRTTDVFLRTMGVSKLEELPELPDISSGDGVKKLEDAIEKLGTVGDNQIQIEEIK